MEELISAVYLRLCDGLFARIILDRQFLSVLRRECMTGFQCQQEFWLLFKAEYKA